MFVCRRETERQRDREPERPRDRETERQGDRETEREDRETERQRDRVSKGRSVVSSSVLVCFCGVEGLISVNSNGFVCVFAGAKCRK